ncbi:MAG: 2-oxoglutarate and iron-dependent oxygenase domain-containing protein [Actinobacteria bacterium]|nr:2-oxoglutarate and iron-dependent oxygenase domain-containing protein [Actinomycetota bacterium]
MDLAGSAEPGAERSAVVGTIRRACEEIGFLVITGHGVPEAVVSDAEDAARVFDSAPTSWRAFLSSTPSGSAGYSGPWLHRGRGGRQ